MKIVRISLIIILFSVLVASCQNAPEVTVAPTAVEPTIVPDALVVYADESVWEIPPTVYGTNYGPWIAVPVDVMDDYLASGIQLLRFPGGAYIDENNIRSSQVDLLMVLAGMIDAEVAASVRLHNGTPEQAVELMAMTNAADPERPVRLWSIGNEPSLYVNMYQDESWDTEFYNQAWRGFAEAMKAADPDILLLGPDIHQFTANPDQNPRDPLGRDWMIEFLKANGELVDVVTIHRYPFPQSAADPNITVAELMASSEEWDDTIPYLRQLILEHTGRDLPIGVMEINSHWSKGTGGEATPDSFANAIWWADSLGRMIRQRVTYVAHFALQTKATQGGWGLLERNEVRPAYYVYQMYQKFGQTLVQTAFEEDSDIQLLGALREDGVLTLIVINRGFSEAVETIQLVGFEASEPARRWLLDETHLATQMDPLFFNQVTEVTVPPLSVTLFEIPGN